LPRHLQPDMFHYEDHHPEVHAANLNNRIGLQYGQVALSEELIRGGYDCWHQYLGTFTDGRSNFDFDSHCIKTYQTHETFADCNAQHVILPLPINIAVLQVIVKTNVQDDESYNSESYIPPLVGVDDVECQHAGLPHPLDKSEVYHCDEITGRNVVVSLAHEYTNTDLPTAVTSNSLGICEVTVNYNNYRLYGRRRMCCPYGSCAPDNFLQTSRSSNCRQLCDENPDCNFFSFDDTMRCTLYSDCGYTRQSAELSARIFQKISNFLVLAPSGRLKEVPVKTITLSATNNPFPSRDYHLVFPCHATVPEPDQIPVFIIGLAYKTNIALVKLHTRDDCCAEESLRDFSVSVTDKIHEDGSAVWRICAEGLPSPPVDGWMSISCGNMVGQHIRIWMQDPNSQMILCRPQVFTSNINFLET